MNKNYLLAVLIVLLIGGLSIVIPNKREKFEAGYCADEDRYATNEEVYDAAIQYLIDYRSQTEDPSVDSKYWPDSRLPKYTDVADFRAKNEVCCTVNLFDKDPTQNSVYLGDNGYSVGVHLRESIDENTSYFSTSLSVKACGQIIGASYSARSFKLTRLRLYAPKLVEKYSYMPSPTFVTSGEKNDCNTG